MKKVLIELYGFTDPKQVRKQVVEKVIDKLTERGIPDFEDGVDLWVRVDPGEIWRQNATNGEYDVFIRVVCVPFNGHGLIADELRAHGYSVQEQHLDSW